MDPNSHSSPGSTKFKKYGTESWTENWIRIRNRAKTNVKNFHQITTCPKSLVHFYTASLLWKLDKTSWTYSIKNWLAYQENIDEELKARLADRLELSLRSGASFCKSLVVVWSPAGMILRNIVVVFYCMSKKSWPFHIGT